MQFTKRLHPGIRSGDITVSVRIWQRPHVKVGNRYRMGDGAIEVDALREIRMDDITPQLARKSGFNGVVDLLKVAKHGPGEHVYLVEFHYVEPRLIESRSDVAPSAPESAPRNRSPRAARPRRSTTP